MTASSSPPASSSTKMDSPNAQSGSGARPFGAKFYRYKTLVKKNWWVLAIMASLGLAYEGWVIYSTPVQHEANSKLTVRESMNEATDQIKYNNFQPETFTATSLA